jgi:hypothetical protein
MAALGLVLGILAPHALLILAGAMLAAVAGHVGFRRLGGVGKLPLLPILTLPLLLVVAYYLRVIAGPVGLSVAAFPDVPLSPAAQLMLAQQRSEARRVGEGPVPLCRSLRSPSLSQVGIALMIRLGHPLLGDAWPGWESLFIPIGILLLWLAALAGAWSPAAGISAWIVAMVVTPAAPEGAWMLGTAALAMAIRRRAAGEGGMSLVLKLLVATSGAAGAAAALAALLAHQVVYATIAAIAGLVLVFGADVGEPVIYSAGSPDLTAHSGAAHGVHTSSSSL